MRIVHVTPHLPPDQAANALLPFQLGEWARARGDEVRFLAHPSGGGGAAVRAHVTWIARTRRSPMQRVLRTGSIWGALNIRRLATPAIEAADIVHVHSNGLLAEVCAAIARQLKKPLILTLYGTEIWHYRRKRFGPDLFTRAYDAADVVTFYSERLLERATELGLSRPRCRVIYPPVAAFFTYHDAVRQRGIRDALGLQASRLLLNVKRLHPLAGQRYLIQAMTRVVASHPDSMLLICGSGASLDELRDVARSAGVEQYVTFAGLVDNRLVASYCAAASVFVLASILEALPTVAVEALASGTPVISSDNPGGIELSGLFGEDVRIVPKENVDALAAAMNAALQEPRRTGPSTQATIERRFRADAVERQYWDAYAEAISARR